MNIQYTKFLCMENWKYLQCKNLFKRLSFRRNSRRYLLLSFVLIFCLSTASADKVNFYDKKEKMGLQEQTSSDFSFFKYGKSEPQTDPSFDLYGVDPLKAPPGGGEPIGGVTPVGDGIWILCLLAAGYICFQFKGAFKNRETEE